MNVTASAVAATAVLALVGCGGSSSPASPSTDAAYTGQRVAAGTTATDFALRDADGRLVRLSDERGRLVLVTFLYTRCPDVCPLVAQNLNTVLRRLGRRAADVRVLAVSVDPEHDTRDAVRTFAQRLRLRPQFSYLVGTEAELRPVWQAYNVLAFRRNAEVVDHSAPILLVDRAGRPRLVYDAVTGPTALLGDVERLLERA